MDSIKSILGYQALILSVLGYIKPNTREKVYPTSEESYNYLTTGVFRNSEYEIGVTLEGELVPAKNGTQLSFF